MLLGGINIPERILTAHEEGRLVIFAGAGVSMSPPSSLPNFLGLATQIGARLQSKEDPASPAWIHQLDAYLGNLDDDDRYDIHRLTQGIVTVPASEPNGNHDALARVAAKGIPRVITTNYDLHLERRLQTHCDPAIEVFKAPAMPLGDAFHGLVYLHGSADAPPERLVVTDRDFSKAYFHSAWAARFLERMFSSYVVLFVGYSHTDVVMRYLGLGLGPRAERYVITDQPHDSIWERLRITVLDYEEGQHHVLTECLTEWADYSEMGLLAHRQRIWSIASGEVVTPTSEDPDGDSPAEAAIAMVTPPGQLSYLEESIRRADRVEFFCQAATDPGWLDWISDKEPFVGLFTRSTPWSEVRSRLAFWYVEKFAFGDEDASKRAWSVFATSSGILSTELWNALAIRLHAYRNDDETRRPPHVLRWLWLLMDQEHAGCASDYLQYALEWEGVWDDRELALALLAHFLTPRLKVDRPGRLTSGLEVSTHGDRYWLEEAWSKKFLPSLDDLVLEVYPVVDQALTRHLILEDRATGRVLGFSWGRAAIQPDDNDKDIHREKIDTIIDAARDCVERLWTINPTFAQQVVARWVSSRYPLLNRLAVHAVGVSPTLDADARARFVVDNECCRARDCLQETFRLLENAAPLLSAPVLDELVTAFAPASDEAPDRFGSYTAYEVLIKAGAVHQPLEEALARIVANHSEFTPDQHPGMNVGMTVSWVQDKPPLTVAEYVDMVAGDPEEAVRFVLGFEERVFPSGAESTRDDALLMVRSVVREQPTVGLQLWPHTTDAVDVRGAIVSAWGEATEAADAAEVLSALNGADLKDLSHQVGQFLLHASSTKTIHWDEVPGVDEFMERVWQLCETNETYQPGEHEDWLSRTINVPVGHLMDFWFRVFHRRWSIAGDTWSGLPGRDREFLDRALADRTNRGAHALTQISGRLEYLDQADSIWCREQLLPCRDWAEPLVAEPFWWGVLSYAKWNPGLVAGGLLAGLIETSDRLDAFTIDQRRRWAGLLASIAVRCEVPSSDTWVYAFTARATVADRERWIDQLAEEVRALDEPGRVAVWETWLGAFWAARTRDDPVVLERAEMNRFAYIAPSAPAGELETAVQLLESTAASLSSHADASRFVGDDLIDSRPELIGRYYAHLMNNTDPQGFYGQHELRPKLLRLVAKPGNWDLLKAAALRLRMDLTKLDG
jgi:hypothetical protein